MNIKQIITTEQVLEIMPSLLEQSKTVRELLKQY